MIKALGRIRTKEGLFEPGEKIVGLTKKEEDWLISINMAKRVEESRKAEDKPDDTKPGTESKAKSDKKK